MIDDMAAHTEDIFLGLKVPPAMRSALKAEAESRNVPMSVVVREVLAKHLEITDRKRKPRRFSQDMPKLPKQPELNLDIAEDTDTTEAA